ncbi:uncharacterized protein LOC111641465 [Centruroides sculpturatus]|uniref:uncharacterized protein LOC111641465 n=1 Tax=Centruroides sculpturatus TaxID=218467 RepID=UPI000C6ED329|nr:uncharacterized protein LOC111641465 [Centruroides sculpturatus]
MEMFQRNLTYFVSVNDCKKVIYVADKKDIIDEILRSFNLVTQNYVLQMYHTEWMDYVDVESLFDIPNKATLKLITYDSPVSNPLHNANLLEKSDNSVSNNKETWPDRFTIPEKQFTPCLLNALANKQKLSWSQKHEFLTVLCDTIMSYTLYPTKAQIIEVAHEIVSTYSHLKGDFTTGYLGWVQCLINKLKNVRRNLKVEAVQKRKKKYRKLI